MQDALRAPRSGRRLRRRVAPAARRDQPGAARRAGEARSAQYDPYWASERRRGRRRPALRRRQRVLRCPADPPVRAQPPTAGTSARSGSRDGKRAFGLVADADSPRCDLPDAVRGADAARSRAQPRRGRAIRRIGARIARQGRRARSSTTATPRRGPARPCRRCAGHAYADPLRSAGRGRPHRPCRFRRAREAAAKAGPRCRRLVDPGRFPRSASASSSAPRSLAPPTPEQRADIAPRRRPPDRARPDGRRCSRSSALHSGDDRPAAAGFRAMSMPARTITRRRARACRGIRHGFFGRSGGVSTGLYATLNGGRRLDRRPRPRRARTARRVADALGVARERSYLLPGAFADVVDRRPSAWTGDRAARPTPWSPTPRPRARHPHRRLRPDPLRRPRRGVIGAAHAGWKGALGGIARGDRRGDGRLGADRATHRRRHRPDHLQANYEVGPEFVARFLARRSAPTERFFAPSRAAGRAFRSPRLRRRPPAARRRRPRRRPRPLHLRRAEKRFFSHRRATHTGEPTTGRQIAPSRSAD